MPGRLTLLGIAASFCAMYCGCQNSPSNAIVAPAGYCFLLSSGQNTIAVNAVRLQTNKHGELGDNKGRILEPVITVPEHVKEVHVAGDGVVWVNLPDGGEWVSIGVLELVRDTGADVAPDGAYKRVQPGTNDVPAMTSVTVSLRK